MTFCSRSKTANIHDLVNETVLRSQSQAEYNIRNEGHFGLNLRQYAHFTSPIRRYADLVVHRALVKARWALVRMDWKVQQAAPWHHSL